MKILVADDEDQCRMLLQDMFATDPRVQLTMARDGAEAWWKLTEPAQRFDLAIFDLRMPTVDGLQLIERVRGSDALRRLPIILCTGINDRDWVGCAARLAINHYVVKPYKSDGMREKIAALAPRRSGLGR
ncbi:MAG TPA: response regulator [Opitutus sp.]|nr:response regulator [Opitutus sp.]